MTRIEAANDLTYVRRVLLLLADYGIKAWLFGGWAEELHGLMAPRLHKDIDLLYPADDFRLVDSFLARAPGEEIVAKRFPHKRAFDLDGIMTELFLVRHDAMGYYTSFWGDRRYQWPDDLLDRVDDLPAASTTALTSFRAKTQDLSPMVDGKAVTAEEWTRHHSRNAGL